MARKGKKINSVDDLKSEEVAEIVKPKIAFESWFASKLAKKQVKFYQDEALLVFMRKQGLKDVENPDLYEEAFKKF